MRRIILILVLILVGQVSFAQKTNGKQLLTEFKKGKLIIFNDYALVYADDSFFKALVKGTIVHTAVIDSVLGAAEYGTLGSKGIVKIKVKTVNALKGEAYQVVQDSILKYFDKKNGKLYYVDGLLNTDMHVALEGVVNKKIKEVNILGPNQGRAIWGNMGSNGVIFIKTNGRVELPME